MEVGKEYPGIIERIDVLLVRRGLALSRQKAQALVMEGKVWIDGKQVEKAGLRVKPHVEIEIRDKGHPYVSRGGVKLEKALNYWDIEVKGKVFLDVGSSTGGFTDCLLQHGAARVYAVDVGYGQLAWKLRCDERVVPVERSNVRYLTRGAFKDELDGAVVDVSFISLKKVIPTVVELVGTTADIVALIKPQFEVGKGEVGKGGVVRDRKKQEEVVEDLVSFSRGLKLSVVGIIESPLLGPRGNREFLMYLKK